MSLKFNFRFGLVLLAFFLFSKASNAQLTCWVGTPKGSTCSDSIIVPVYAKNFNSIVDFTIGLQWDTTNVYVSPYGSGFIFDPTIKGTAACPHALLSDIGYCVTDQVKPDNNGGLGIFFSGDLAGTTISQDSILILEFVLHYKNGVTPATPIKFFWANGGNFNYNLDTADASGNLTNGPTDTVFINKTYNALGYKTAYPTISAASGVLSATVVGPVPTSYQWYTVSGTTYSAISMATSSTYNTTNTPGVYSVAALFGAGACIDTAKLNDTIKAPLPIKLLNFNGKNVNKTNVLNWATATEINTSEFIIERSTDGKNFSQIGTVSAAGNSASAKSYGFTDASFLSFASYYRLKIVDQNGSFTYSTIVKLNRHGNAVFQIQPNPVENSTVNVYGSNMKFAKIYDVNGKLLLTQNITNADQAQFKVNNLTKGVYMINITSTEGDTQTEKFIIK